MENRYEDVLKQFELWLSQTKAGDGVHEELATLKEKLDSDQRQEALEEIYEAFFQDLAFGTGGLRGILGAGSNRMNIYTVGKAARGLADYILEQEPEDPSVAISCDTRNGSRTFADLSAKIMAVRGIRVHLFEEARPTPMLSFAVRHFQTTAGIMVTASHNPAIYNGYKVYNDEGCQLNLEQSDAVIARIENVDPFRAVREAEQAGEPVAAILPIGPEISELYTQAVLNSGVGVDCSDLQVVYSPLNGSGLEPALAVMDRLGVGAVHLVESQRDPDGNFPTCPYPNPEKEEALAESIRLCRQLGGVDLIMATDPDGDRIGLALCDGAPDSQPVLITGNQAGILMLDFLCHLRPRREDGVVIKTIVTSHMVKDICDRFGLEMREVLTGFKFIGEIMGQLERQGGEDRYFFGFEESYGYLAGSYVRDKDAIAGVMLACQMAAYYKAQGMTLLDRLHQLYQEYGYYVDRVREFTFEGSAGMEAMAGILADLRRDPPRAFAGSPVSQQVDYEHDQTGLPRSQVLRYYMANGAGLIVRPSGTEPKLKVYLSAKEKSREASEALIARMEEAIEERIEKAVDDK